jgi:hypothetical protein
MKQICTGSIGLLRLLAPSLVPGDIHLATSISLNGGYVMRSCNIAGGAFALGAVSMRSLFSAFLLLALLTPPTNSARAQQHKYETQIAPGVAVPDKLDTSIGTLNLSYGYPDDATVQKIYDNLDASRALQAYLMGIPLLNQAGMRASLRQFGPDNQTDVIWKDLVDARTVELTANDNTVYNFIWLDTHKGPLVIEAPPKVLGAIDDFYYRWVADVGITGADKGQGGKYLVLPPGNKGEVPSGYHVVRPNTFWELVFLPSVRR